jgi:hypothetical protein
MDVVGLGAIPPLRDRLQEPPPEADSGGGFAPLPLGRSKRPDGFTDPSFG